MNHFDLYIIIIMQQYICHRFTQAFTGTKREKQFTFHNFKLSDATLHLKSKEEYQAVTIYFL